MAKCKDCGETASDLGWDHTTNWDKASIRNGTRGAHPAHLALLGLSIAVKYACTTVYYCSKCKKTWREWFP